MVFTFSYITFVWHYFIIMDVGFKLFPEILLLRELTIYINYSGLIVLGNIKLHVFKSFALHCLFFYVIYCFKSGILYVMPYIYLKIYDFCAKHALMDFKYIKMKV